MTDNEMWLQLLTVVLSGAAGAIVFKVMEFIKKLTDPVHPLTPRAKFYLSILLAFLIPIGVYLTVVFVGATPFTIYGFFAAALSGWTVSQSINFEDGSEKRRLEREQALLEQAERGTL
jgi:hypothetical protein